MKYNDINKGYNSQCIPGEVIVGFTSNVSCTSYTAVKLIEQNGGKVKEVLSDDPIINILLVEVPEGFEETFIENINNAPIVKYAKLNYKNVILQGHHYSTDPLVISTVANSRYIRYERLYIPHEWVGGGVSMNWHGDDVAWGLPLPFDFPFYGANYSSIYVSSNGLITFNEPETDFANSVSALATKVAVSPAWDDWTTGEEPYDIFVWENSTQVGIRWYVRAWGTSVIANFEAILKISGEIQFNYEFSDGLVSATIGISNGAGDILAEDVTTLNFINSIVFRPFLPEHDLCVSLDSPNILKMGDTVSLNATVNNQGLNNETNVNLKLIINGNVVDSETIPKLLSEKSYTLSYSWTPSIEGIYNITAYVAPVSEEQFVDNNAVIKIVEVVAGYFPSDPMYVLQWHFRQIECPNAWEIVKGNPNVVVAVIDSGVDYDHPDLYSNVWHNIHEVPFNGIDDDHNGYVDDYIGWDFAENDSDPMDCDGHGTHCAGIIAAVMDNSIGGCGIAPNVKIMPIKIFKPSPCAVATTVKRNVTDADTTLALLRKFRNEFLLAKYVKVYYEYSHDVVKILLEEPVLLCDAARLIEKYTPAVRYLVGDKGEDIVMTPENVNEIINFVERLKEEVSERKENIGVKRSSDLIQVLEDFEEQVRLSEGKTFSQAFRNSVYFGKSIKTARSRIETTDAWVIKGIKYAADSGAHIISMSFGGYDSEAGPKPDIEDACDYAYSKGCLLVASAGNDAKREVCYPAKYNSVIAVSAIDFNSLFSRFQDANGDGDYLDSDEATNYGPEIELCAPGGGDINGDGDSDDEKEYIYSTVWDDTYGGSGWVGTSMSTPHVCGVAALIKSNHFEWSNEQLRTVLRITATDLGIPGKDEIYGYGKVNAYAAVASNLPDHDLALFLHVPHLVKLKDLVDVDIFLTNCGSEPETNVSLKIIINGSIAASKIIPYLSSGELYKFSYPWIPAVEGDYNITVYVPPISGEEITENNIAIKLTKVLPVSNIYKLTHIPRRIHGDESYIYYTAEEGGTYRINKVTGVEEFFCDKGHDLIWVEGNYVYVGEGYELSGSGTNDIYKYDKNGNLAWHVHPTYDGPWDGATFQFGVGKYYIYAVAGPYAYGAISKENGNIVWVSQGGVTRYPDMAMADLKNEVLIECGYWSTNTIQRTSKVDGHIIWQRKGPTDEMGEVTQPVDITDDAVWVAWYKGNYPYHYFYALAKWDRDTGTLIEAFPELPYSCIYHVGPEGSLIFKYPDEVGNALAWNPETQELCKVNTQTWQVYWSTDLGYPLQYCGNRLFIDDEYIYLRDKNNPTIIYQYQWTTTSKDSTPPKTTLTIGEPKYVTDTIYVTPETPFKLNASDHGGTGVALTTYRMRNDTYESGWTPYTRPFHLAGLSDGIYAIDFNSTDKADNMEPINTINVVLFSWDHTFTDTYGRNTVLKINLVHRFFQLITPDKDYGIRKATYMQQCINTIIIRHYDNELQLTTFTIDTKLDLCIATIWDLQNGKCYFLLDVAGTEKNGGQLRSFREVLFR